MSSYINCVLYDYTMHDLVKKKQRTFYNKKKRILTDKRVFLCCFVPTRDLLWFIFLLYFSLMDQYIFKQQKISLFFFPVYSKKRKLSVLLKRALVVRVRLVLATRGSIRAWP